MTTRYIITICVITVLVTACSKLYDNYYLNLPSHGDQTLVEETRPLTERSKVLMDGIYRVEKGNDLLGDTVVLKWHKEMLSMYGKPQGVYALMKGGDLDSVLFFQGYWRRALSDETGLIDFYIRRSEGGAELIHEIATPITMKGLYGNDLSNPSDRIVLSLIKRLPTQKELQRFGVIAHRGGGRTSDKLPVSENTPKMIEFAEYLGAKGVEIDTRLSKDDSVMCYHDSDINIRLTQKGPIMGPVEQYTFNQLRTLVRLYHGEQMPTLREMLEFMLHKTSMTFVWLDNKDAKSMEKTIPMVMEFNKAAKEMGRDMVVVIGMPNAEIMEAYLNHPDHKRVPALCELTVSDVEKVNAAIWGPRWTMGIQSQEVKTIHSQGRFAVLWTLDDPVFMHEFVEQGEFDGMLTNYPTLLSYYYYVKMCR